MTKTQLLFALTCLFMVFNVSYSAAVNNNVNTAIPVNTVNTTSTAIPASTVIPAIPANYRNAAEFVPAHKNEISFYFQDVDVRTLLDLIAKTSGVNFIISDAVK